MGVNFISMMDYPSGQIIEFNMQSEGNKDIKAIKDRLVLREELSFGKIYNQQDSGDLWYVNPEETIARLISIAHLVLFHMWDKKSLVPDDKQLERLIRIGGLPSSPYSTDAPSIEFPAAIKTKSGELIDLCLIHFSKAPPVQRHFKRILLLDEIEEIMPSELALPHELRLASTLAEEIRMSFYPFMVRTNTGRLITYNGITQFASTGDVKGNEIVEEVEFSYDKFQKVKDVPFDDITFVIGKWDDRLEKLFDQYSAGSERKTVARAVPKERRSWLQRLFGQ